MAGFREFLTGEVLTAANVNTFLMRQSVMVFADGTARDSALGTAIAGGNALVEGMLTYNKDTEALEVYDGTAWGSVVSAKEKRIEAFTGSGTWTVPAGVTYAIAHMKGGGGGVGRGLTAGDGAASSVAFATGTVSADGGKKMPGNSGDVEGGQAGAANSGLGATCIYTVGVNASNFYHHGNGGAEIVAAAAVTPAASITVTVGAGGAAGTGQGPAAGGSGYVYIEYYEEV